MSKILNRVFDFDGTIYNGNSTLDFFRFEFKRNILNFFLLPIYLVLFLRYKFGRLTLQRFIELAFHYLIVNTNLEYEAELFWNRKYLRVKKFYFSIKSPNDIVISASPEFLLKPVCRKLNVRLIASRFDVRNLKFVGNMCMDVEKLVRVIEYGIKSCDEFYTDSIEADAPMVSYAKKAFEVKGENIKMISERH